MTAPHRCDPRVMPVLTSLTDAQVAEVLRQMNAAWRNPTERSPVLRDLMVDTITDLIELSGEPAFTTLEHYAAIARTVASPHAGLFDAATTAAIETAVAALSPQPSRTTH